MYMKKAYLILEDGHVFEGYSFGADVKGVGELVFNTQLMDCLDPVEEVYEYVTSILVIILVVKLAPS